MTKKVYNLVVACVGAAATIASAVVTYVAPAGTTAIVASIGIVATAIIEVCNQFVKED